MKTYVLYHNPCRDGFTAAWAVFLALGDEDVEYLPVRYREPPPEIPEGSKVYIIDFAYDRETLLAMDAAASELVVLDHHASAQRDLEDLDFATFDMKRSGAGMAWDYFHEGPRPWVINYVEDYDLWTKILPDIEAVSCFLDTQHFDFKTWSSLPPLEEAQAQGKAILTFRDILVKRSGRHAHQAKIGGYTVPVVNTQHFVSEIGHHLLDVYPDAPFSGTYWIKEDGDTLKWSIRGRGDIDLSVVAKEYGGGGHPSASGFHTLLGEISFS